MKGEMYIVIEISHPVRHVTIWSFLHCEKPSLSSVNFPHCRYMKGEEGFCLTSFRTALRFVLHMSS